MCSSRTSGTNGTSGTGQVDPDAAWRSRWFAAAVLRVAAIAGPLALGTVSARVVVDALAPRMSRWPVMVLALLAATVVSLGAARLALRLMPLATLLKMTMLFPDRAPSRLKVARRATSTDEIKRYLADPDAGAEETAVTLLALVTALGRHDRKTRGHSERVRLYCDLLGSELGLSSLDRGRLRWTGLLHDIGKLRVAAEVLNKPGKLDEDEWAMIRTHPDNGAKLAGPLAEWLGPWYTGIAEHHERFDGAGYPRGLAGVQISLAGRAVSVVDAFETMTAARSYKSPMTTAAARAELTRCAGAHFDPVMVRAFLSIALPRLLWTMGPLTFLVNAPFLRWIPAATERAATVANASVGAASSAVGVTAVSVALVAGQSPVLMHAHPHPHHAEAASSRMLTTRPAAVPGGTRATGSPARHPGVTVSAATHGAAARATHGPIEPAASATIAPTGPVSTGPVSTSPEPTSDAGAGPHVDAVTASSSEPPTPPGRTKKSADPTVPPGQAKKSGDPTVPPGQAKKSGDPTVPPGQAKKSGGPTVPPGQAKKSGGPVVPPGQAKKSGGPTVPPGQAKKSGDPTVPPGQAKKSADPTPPPDPASVPTVPPGHSGETHGHDHDHGHDYGHDHGHGRGPGR